MKTLVEKFSSLCICWIHIVNYNSVMRLTNHYHVKTLNPPFKWRYYRPEVSSFTFPWQIHSNKGHATLYWALLLYSEPEFMLVKQLVWQPFQPWEGIAGNHSREKSVFYESYYSILKCPGNDFYQIYSQLWVYWETLFAIQIDALWEA